MKHFNIQFVSWFWMSLLALVGFFSYSISAQAQPVISSEPLFVTGVNTITAYPFYEGFNSVPSVCIVASFTSSQATEAVVRFSPANLDVPSWTYSNNIINFMNGSSSGIVELGTGMSPNTEYVIQFLELGNDGTYHFITPDVGGDEVVAMCTPTQAGNIGNCQLADQVVELCPPPVTPDVPHVSIVDLDSTETTIFFNVVSHDIPEGTPLYVVASAQASHISGGDYTSAPISVAITALDNTTVSVSLPGLLSNTTYYITILDQTQTPVLLAGQNNYVTKATEGLTDEDTDPQEAIININIDYNQTQLVGENIAGGLVQCGFGELYDCDFNALLATIDRVIKFILYIIILPLSALLFAYAGIKLIVAGAKAKEGELRNAKAMFLRVLVGLIIAMGAWLLVKFLLVILGYTDASGVITNILGITLTQ